MKPLLIDSSFNKISRAEKNKIKRYVEEFENSNSTAAMGILNYEPLCLSNNFIVYVATVCEIFNTEHAISCNKQVQYIICDSYNNIISAKFTANKNSGKLFANIENGELLNVNYSHKIEFTPEQQKELEYAKTAIKARMTYEENCR